MLKVLFVSSQNRKTINPIVKSQGESLANKGLKVDYFGIKGRGIWGYLSNINALSSEIRKLNPDIIHAHYSLSGIVAGITVKHKPLVVSLMGSDTKSGYFEKQITRFFSKYIWDKIIVKSHSMYKDLAYSNAIIIPNGVDLSLFTPVDHGELKEKFNFPKNKIVILFLANPERPVKNYQLAEDAINIIGSEYLSLQVRYGLTQKIVPEILNAADIVLLTSKWEGSPNIVKEAMACNVPVVATDVGDIRWLFGNEPGYFISGFSPQEMAFNINKAAEFIKTTRKTEGRNRIKILGLDSETTANKIISIYKSLL